MSTAQSEIINLEDEVACDDFNLKLEFPAIALLSRDQIIEFIKNEKSL